jgi:hypothetical protein
MKKMRLICIAFIVIAINFSNAQDLEVTYPTYLIVQELNSDNTIVRVDSTYNRRRHLVEKFKDERKEYMQSRRKSTKYYNPVTFVYRLLGI